MRYVREEIVHAPGARVWQLLLDLEKWPGWTESMQELQRLEDGPLAAGSRSRDTAEAWPAGLDGHRTRTHADVHLGGQAAGPFVRSGASHR